MNIIERIQRLARNCRHQAMNPYPGNLHACLDILDLYIGITTARATGAILYTGAPAYDTAVGKRVRQHERHAGFIDVPYFWLGSEAETLGALAQMG